MERQHILNYIIIFLIISSVFSGIIVNSDSGDDWIIDGDMVYVDDELVYASAEPHTLHGRQWVEFNFRSKVYTGDIDFIWGFDVPTVKPVKVEIWDEYTHYYLDVRTVEHWGSIEIENVTSYDNLGIENYDSYDVELGNENNTFLFEVFYDENGNGTSLSKIYAFTSYVVDGDDYTLSGNYDKDEMYYREETFFDWKPFNAEFETLAYDYGGMNTWYLLDGVPITQGVNYKIRALIKSPVSLDGGSGKYWWAFKPSSETLSEAIGNNHFYCLDPWWSASWSYYMPVTTDGSLHPALTNYPVLVNVPDEVVALCQANGEDLRFLDVDNTTEFYYQIDTWDTSGSGGTYVWVNITSLTDADYTFLMYYGNAGASDSQSTNTWDSNFVGVYHMNASTTQANGLFDWSGSGNHGSFFDSLPTTNTTASFIGQGQEYDGTNDYISLPVGCHTPTSGTYEGMWEADTSSAGQRLYNSGDDGDYRQHFDLRWDVTRHDINTKWTAGNEFVATDGTDPDTSKHYYSLKFESGCQDAHRDGTKMGHDTDSTGSFTFDDFYIGVGGNVAYSYYDGIVDELRISNIMRSDDWVGATYNISANTDTFCSFGTQQESAPSNNAPTEGTPIPADTSTAQKINPTIGITVDDADGDNMNISWWSNTSGSWKVFATTNAVGDGAETTNNYNFSDFSTKYWWNVTVEDGEGGEVISSAYSFTTIENYAPTITNPSPANASTGEALTPTLSIDINDDEGNLSSIGWESNSSGSWKDFASTTGAGNGSHTAVGANFTAGNTKYWWRTTVHDGTSYNTTTYYFTTTEIVNFAPTITLGSPADGANQQQRPPLTSVNIVDQQGDTFNVSWQSNSSGSWKTWGTNLSLNNGTVSDTNTNFSASNTTYYWRVIAHDGKASNTSSIWRFHTLEGVDVPTGVSLFRDDATNNILVTWTKGVNSTHTRVQRKAGSEPTTISDGTNVYNDTGTLGFTDTTTLDGIQYYYSFWAFNSTLHEWSSSYATDNIGTRPSAPTALAVTIINNNSLNVSWTKGAEADKTEVRYLKNVNPNLVTDGTSGYNDTASSADIGSLDGGATYFFKAWSWNETVKLFSYGNSSGFNTTSSQPSNCTNLQASSFNDTQINLSWTAGNGTQSILIRNEFVNPTTVTNGTEIFNASGTSYLDVGLNVSSRYYYSIWSYNGGLYSEGYISADNYTRPQEPQNTTGDLDGVAVNLTWDNATGADNYIVRKENGAYPQNITDGSELYNGTGWFYNDTTYTAGDLYSIWSYNNDSKLYSRIVNILWGGLRINVYDEETGLAVDSWTVKITNYDTTVQYTNQNNPRSIDINLLPYGANTVIIINATNYLPRMYIMDIFANGVYTLNAYIPKDNATNLSHYILVVQNQIEQYVEDAKIKIKRFIDGSYQTIITDLTDGSGEIDVYLFANELYLIEISKDLYVTQTTHWQPPTIVYYDDAIKKFIIVANETAYNNETYYHTYITFNGYRNSTHAFVNYTDSLLMTTSTNFIVYEINTTTGNEVAYYWYNLTNQTIQFNFTIDPNNHYRVELNLVHLIFSYYTDSFLLRGDRELPTTKDEFESLFDAVFGNSSIAWSAIAGLFVLLACLFMFGQRHIGIGICLAGLVMLGLSAGLGLALLDTTLSIIILVFGILVQWQIERSSS